MILTGWVLLRAPAQIDPSAPRTNRDEDLRRQTEQSRPRRQERQQKALGERREPEFRQNSAQFMDLARETCKVNLPNPAAGRLIPERATKMEAVPGQSLFYFDRIGG